MYLLILCQNSMIFEGSPSSLTESYLSRELGLGGGGVVLFHWWIRTGGVLNLGSLNSLLHRTCSVKKMFLEISQNSHENTCVRASGLRPATLLKKGLWYSYFPVNFAKFLRTPFFTEHLQWLLLLLQKP